MANVFRGPLIPRPRRALPAAKEFLSSGLAQRLEDPTFPLRQRDWPRPAPPIPPRARDYLWVNQLAVLYETHPPFINYDWELPNPRVPITRETPQPNSLVARTSVFPSFRNDDWETPNPRLPKAQDFIFPNWYAANPPPAPVTFPPFIQNDWERPADPRIKAQDYPFNNDLARALEGPFPLRQRDWPLPARADSPRARDYWFNNQLAVIYETRPPFLNYDWPRAKDRDSPRARDYAFLNQLAVIYENTPTFRQLDWPLAARRDSPRARDYNFINDLPRRVEIIPPFWNRDFPSAARRDSPRARDYWFINDLAALYESVPPLRLRDWPLPQRKDSPRARDYVFDNDLARRLEQRVFPQYNWPTPQRVRLTVAGQTLNTRNDVPAVVTTPTARQYDWPLARRTGFIFKDQVAQNIAPILLGFPGGQYNWPLASLRAIGVAEGQFYNPSPHYPPTPEEFRPKGWIEPRHRPDNPDWQDFLDALERQRSQKPGPAVFRVKGLASDAEIFAPSFEVLARPEPAPDPRVQVSVRMLHPASIHSAAVVGVPAWHDHEMEAIDALRAIEALLGRG